MGWRIQALCLPLKASLAVQSLGSDLCNGLHSHPGPRFLFYFIFSWPQFGALLLSKRPDFLSHCDHRAKKEEEEVEDVWQAGLVVLVNGTALPDDM